MFIYSETILNYAVLSLLIPVLGMPQLCLWFNSISNGNPTVKCSFHNVPG